MFSIVVSMCVSMCVCARRVCRCTRYLARSLAPPPAPPRSLSSPRLSVGAKGRCWLVDDLILIHALDALPTMPTTMLASAMHASAMHASAPVKTAPSCALAIVRARKTTVTPTHLPVTCLSVSPRESVCVYVCGCCSAFYRACMHRGTEFSMLVLCWTHNT